MRIRSLREGFSIHKQKGCRRQDKNKLAQILNFFRGREAAVGMTVTLEAGHVAPFCFLAGDVL